MKNSIAFLASTLFIAPTLRAQVRSASPNVEWVGPVAGAVAAAGTDHIATLGSPSLTNLSALNPNGQFPFTVQPQILAPLVEAISRAQTPQSFAALSVPERVAALHAAAKTAEETASAAAAEAVAAVQTPLHEGNYAEASNKVAAAEANVLYMTKETAEQVTAARAAVSAFETRRDELIKAFLRELPEKVEAGEFTPQNLIRRDGAGWYAADDSPKNRYKDLEALYSGRIDAVAKGPAGPWTVAQYELLRGSLDQPETAEALDANFKGSHEAWTDSMLPSRRLRQRIDALIASSRNWASNRPRLRAAMARYAAGTMRPKDAAAVETYYSLAYDRYHHDLTSRAWIEASIHQGSASLPSWDELGISRRRLETVYGRNALRSIAGFAAAVVGVAAFGNSNWPPLAKLAGVGAAMLPLLWAMYFLYRRDSMSWSTRRMDFDMIRGARRRVFGED